MYRTRFWHQSDLFWLQQATSASALETLDPDQRQADISATAAARAVERLQTALFTPGGTALIVTVGPEPVAYAVLAIAPDTTTGEMQGLVIDLWVAPAHRRRGIARSLQRSAESLFAQHGIFKLKFWTSAGNQPALALAHQSGYQIEGLINEKPL